jgi:putative endonuclease
MSQRTFFVYILTNPSRVLYVGVTSHLVRRLFEHRSGAVPGFSTTHQIYRLVYYESTSDAISAIAREKQLKGWKRIRKLRLIESMNPEWKDLAEGWL